MQTLRLPIVVFGILFVIACSTSAPPQQPAKHLRQSSRHLNRATGLFIKGCHIRALRHYQQAHERYAASDQLEGLAHSLNGMANTYYRLNELSNAILAYDEAIETYGLIKARSGMVRAMCNKAAALIASGQLDEAEALLDQTDKLAGMPKPALRQKTRAILLMRRDEDPKAEALLKKAIKAANANEPEQVASTNYTLGRLLLTQQRSSQAIAYFKQSLALDRAEGAYDNIAHDLAALGECHTHLGQKSQAVAHFKRSIKIFALLGNSTKVQELAEVLKRQAQEHDVDIQATLHWAIQWLAGNKEANLCR